MWIDHLLTDFVIRLVRVDLQDVKTVSRAPSNAISALYRNLPPPI